MLYLKQVGAAVAALAFAGACAQAEDEAAGSDRRTKPEIVAAIDASVQKARETRGDGSPALWSLSDEDTTIYIFGTIHLLPEGLDWRSSAFGEAFDAADTLVVELDTASPEGALAVQQAFISRGVYTDGGTLSATLNDEDEAIVGGALDSVGLTIGAVDQLKPWLVSLQMTISQFQKDGFDPAAGVDTVLLNAAAESGKDLVFLETAAEQASVFADLPEEVQVNLLVESATVLSESSTTLTEIVGEWQDGDIAGIANLAANPDAAGDNDFYKALLVDRNRNWVPKITALLEEPGVKFIAAGAGHFAGPDSVITMLRADGYEVEGP